MNKHAARCGLLLLLALLQIRTVTAQELRWGGDSEGGAPYVFQDPKTPPRLSALKLIWPMPSPGSSIAAPFLCRTSGTG